MIKIVLLLSLALLLNLPVTPPLSGTHESDCAAVGSRDPSCLLGEILDDDTNIVFGSLLAESFPDPINAAAARANICCCGSNSRSIPHKKALPLYKLQEVFLI